MILWDEVGEDGGHRHRPHRARLRRGGLCAGQGARPACHRAAGRGRASSWRASARFTGTHVSESAERSSIDLRQKGLLYKVEDYTHRYPVCWRCRTELVFRLVDEWFISMDELRHDMMDVTEQIRWIPSFGLERELDWLRNMHDWMISKKRYWGLALPIWECDECGHFEVIGDEHELEERAVDGLGRVRGAHAPPALDRRGAHRLPRMRRGGQPHPRRGQPLARRRHRQLSARCSTGQIPNTGRSGIPADWISESFPGQFRNWFYSLLAMATVLENTPPFMTCFGYATLLAEDGREMHKSLGQRHRVQRGRRPDGRGRDALALLRATSRRTTCSLATAERTRCGGSF